MMPRSLSQTGPEKRRFSWPKGTPQILALLLVLLVDSLVAPHFYQVVLQDGRLFGSPIDILNRAAPVALLAIGMYISSVTESQAVAAGLCFVVMLVNYFLSDLAGFASSTAYSSLAALALTALIVCGIVYLMTKNGFVSLILAAVLEAGLIGAYLWDSSRFEGLFPQIISQLSLFARFYTIVNGVFDVTAIVYYLSVTGFFLFLSVQSLEKRRWSE